MQNNESREKGEPNARDNPSVPLSRKIFLTKPASVTSTPIVGLVWLGICVLVARVVCVGATVTFWTLAAPHANNR